MIYPLKPPDTDSEKKKTPNDIDDLPIKIIPVIVFP